MNFLIRFLLPAPLGALGLMLGMLPSTDTPGDWLMVLLGLTFYGYIFIGAPSLFYALLFCLLEKFDCGAPVRLGVAGLIGGASGLWAGLMLNMPVVGVATGLAVGLGLELLTLRRTPAPLRP